MEHRLFMVNITCLKEEGSASIVVLNQNPVILSKAEQ